MQKLVQVGRQKLARRQARTHIVSHSRSGCKPAATAGMEQCHQRTWRLQCEGRQALLVCLVLLEERVDLLAARASVELKCRAWRDIEPPVACLYVAKL